MNSIFKSEEWYLQCWLQFFLNLYTYFNYLTHPLFKDRGQNPHQHDKFILYMMYALLNYIIIFAISICAFNWFFNVSGIHSHLQINIVKNGKPYKVKYFPYTKKIIYSISCNSIKLIFVNVNLTNALKIQKSNIWGAISAADSFRGSPKINGGTYNALVVFINDSDWRTLKVRQS